MKVNKTAIVCLIIFAVITILRITKHVPWFDEAHAWTIAEQLNFVDMFKYTMSEGHFFIWQTLLYPFAHSHIIPYPYPMQALNWIFCLSAMIIMWWKAPFNNWIKALITFSFPFLGCYGVLARCYSIGILLLFALAALFDKKLQYPKTYALLLILCANTSVMALIGATAFGILFLVDIFKDKFLKKYIIYVGIILILGAVLIIYQIFNFNFTQYFLETRTLHFSVKTLYNIFLNNNIIFNGIILVSLVAILVKFFYKCKISLFFMIFTQLSLAVFLMILYDGHFWHSYFSYIYLIISFWLVNDKNNISFKKTAIVIFALLSLFLVFKKPVDYSMSFDNSKFKILYNAIENDEILKHSQIIQNDFVLYELIPYSYGKNYVIRNHCTSLANHDYIFTNTFDKFCAIRLTTEQAKRHPDIIKKIVLQGKNTYTFIDTKYYNMTKNEYLFSEKNYNILFKKYKCYGRYCFWKIEVKQ